MYGERFFGAGEPLVQRYARYNKKIMTLAS